MSKVDEVMILARNYNGCIPMDDDGNVVYVVKPVDDENYDDIPDKLAEQLKQEGKYGWYASICVNRNHVSAKNLPKVSSNLLLAYSFLNSFSIVST